MVNNSTCFATRENDVDSAPVGEIKAPRQGLLPISPCHVLLLEIVITRAAPAFRKLFMVMGCVFDVNTVHKTVEKLTFQAFY